MSTWRKLERALLLSSRERFGEVPECNLHGKKFKERDEFKYFSKTKVSKVIDELT